MTWDCGVPAVTTRARRRPVASDVVRTQRGPRATPVLPVRCLCSPEEAVAQVSVKHMTVVIAGRGQSPASVWMQMARRGSACDSRRASAGSHRRPVDGHSLGLGQRPPRGGMLRCRASK